MSGPWVLGIASSTLFSRVGLGQRSTAGSSVGLLPAVQMDVVPTRFLGGRAVA